MRNEEARESMQRKRRKNILILSEEQKKFSNLLTRFEYEEAIMSISQ